MCLKQQESNEEIVQFGFLNQFVIVALTVPVVVIGIFWDSILMLAQGAKIFIQ
jgi:NADH-quinone oxidoreductase subunit N